MLATLGIVVQGSGALVPGFPIQETNAFTALKNCYYTNPSALVQVSASC